MHGKPKQWSLYAFLGTLLVLLLLPSRAHAQRELLTPAGSKGQLAIDSLMGFRIGAFNGIQYAGPLGFSIQSYKETNTSDSRADSTTRLTTFWFAPAADYFIIDRLSVGGLIEVASTSGSVKSKTPLGGGTVEREDDLPTTTSFTFLPRVGYMIPIGSRFAIWPRGGIGYASRQNSNIVGTTTTKQTFSSAIFAVDVPFLFRVNETFFVSAAPELLFSLGGEHSATLGGGSVSADASFVQFGLVTGLGVLLPL